ncbi:MAG: hypothetical protein AAGF60_10145 [Pseudomonadota bacterium]
MTEKTAHNIWMPAPRPARYLVDPVAFFIALIGAPLLVTLASFWLFLIPVFALVLGGPIYLILGTPLLLFHLRRDEGKSDSIVALAMMTVLAGAWRLALARSSRGRSKRPSPCSLW